MVVHTPFLPRMDAVASWRLYHYTLPLTVFAHQREGLILQTTFAGNNQGWGEIAPLPGRSKETLAEAQEQLLQALHGKLRSPLLPSVAFGLECAFTPYTPPTNRFPLWALLAGTPDAIKDKAQRAEQEGFRSIKIKVSSLSPSDAESVIRPLIGRFQLRIDVNRAWSFDEAVDFFSRFPEQAIACVEEPTYELDRLSAIPFPFALDESLPEIPFSHIATFPHLTTLIIKPTITGGSYALKIIEQLGKQIIFTGAFESGIGTAQIAMLAHRLYRNNLKNREFSKEASQNCQAKAVRSERPLPSWQGASEHENFEEESTAPKTNSSGYFGINLMENPLGLDTYRFLQEDLLDPPLDFSKGSLELPSQLNLNRKHLIEVAHG